MCCGMEASHVLSEGQVHLLMGLDLDTGVWELVHADRDVIVHRGGYTEWPMMARPMELRPHLVL